MSTTDPDFWIIAGVILVGTIMSWGSIAYDSLINSREARTLKITINDLAEQARRIQPSNVPLHMENLTLRSNAQLKDAVADWAASVRELEANWHAQQSNALNQHYEGAENEKQASDRWRAGSDAIVSRALNNQTIFRNRFLPTGAALLEELRARLGIERTLQNRIVALDFQVLAGPHPLTDAAAALERLTRKLG